MHPRTAGILETSLYVEDVPASARFYVTVFGFRVISDFGGRGCAMAAGEQQVLLLFKKGASRAMPPPQAGAGELPLALPIAAGELPRWEAWLAKNGIAVEENRGWEWGGRSLY